jgi:hypothetical protein
MLTRLKIESEKPSLRRQRLFDGRGLYLEISPTGGRWWRFKYRFAGKEKRISLGVYPEVGIKEARDRREDARKQVAAGIDPGAKRKAEAAALVENTENTFKAVAEEWVKLNSNKWSSANTYKITRLFERDIYPWIGERAVSGIGAQELLRVCRRIEGRNANETTHRALQNCGRVSRNWTTGGARRSPMSALSSNRRTPKWSRSGSGEAFRCGLTMESSALARRTRAS